MQGEHKKRKAGDRLPASYINFVRINEAAIIPTFGVTTDARFDALAYPCSLLPSCMLWIGVVLVCGAAEHALRSVRN